MAERFSFDPDWVVAPGETLKEWCTEIGLSDKLAAVVAEGHGIGAATWEKLLAGDEPITEKLARRLAAMTYVSAAFWRAMEHNYRVGLAAGKKRS